MRNIVVEELKQGPVEDQKVEIVERKGIGHPDTICVPPETLIIGNPIIKPISEFQVGEKVLTHSGNFKPISSVIYRHYKGKLALIKPYHGEKILLTPNHPVLTISTEDCRARNFKSFRICKLNFCKYHKNHFKNYKLTWMPAEKIKKGYYIVISYPTKIEDIKYIEISKFVRSFILKDNCIYGYHPGKYGKPQRNPKSHPIPNRIKVSCEFMRLVGYYLAEGSTSKDFVSFSFNKNENEYVDDVVKLVKKIFHLNCRVKLHPTSKVVFIDNRLLVQFFKNLFENKSTKKRLPEWMLFLSKEKQYELLVGLFHGDGCIDKNDTINYVTTSLQLAYQIRVVLFRLGILNSIFVKKGRMEKLFGRNYLTKTSTKYTITLHKNLTKIFGKCLKNKKRNEFGFIKKGLVHLPVKYVKEVEYSGYVYNLKVDEDNSYTLPSATLHNCDSIMNEISINLSQEYIKKVGTIMHHNIDKALLAAGEVESKFGGGVVNKPMLLVIGDRATFDVGNVHIPVDDIAIKTTKKWFKDNLRFVDPEDHVKYQIELKHGSAALQDIFKRRGEVLGANDTSAGVGYAPMTQTEKLVWETERFLNSKKFKKEFPETGEDIKVMGLRTGSDLTLTVSVAFVDRFIDSEQTYFKRKEDALQALNEFVRSNYSFKNVNVWMNTLDEKGRGLDGLYLTVLGTSADGADCGQVGRGNRVNGIIPLNRPTSSEAAAGKNPVSHVGKIYNALSFKIADEIYKRVEGLREVYFWLLSQIGRPIDHPKIAAAQIILKDGNSISEIRKEVHEVVDSELENINKFCADLASGKIKVC